MSDGIRLERLSKTVPGIKRLIEIDAEFEMLPLDKACGDISEHEASLKSGALKREQQQLFFSLPSEAQYEFQIAIGNLIPPGQRRRSRR